MAVRSGRLKADRWAAVAFSSPPAVLSAFSGPWGGCPESGPPASLRLLPEFPHQTAARVPSRVGHQQEIRKAGHRSRGYVQAQAALEQALGPTACRRRRWRPMSSGSPSSHGLGQEPGVEVGPVTDDARGCGAGGDAAAPAAQPPEEATRQPTRRVSACSCCPGRSRLPLSEPTRPPGASESDSRAWPGPRAGGRCQAPRVGRTGTRSDPRTGDA